jgi:hypothetical protein
MNYSAEKSCVQHVRQFGQAVVVLHATSLGEFYPVPKPTVLRFISQCPIRTFLLLGYSTNICQECSQNDFHLPVQVNCNVRSIFARQFCEGFRILFKRIISRHLFTILELVDQASNIGLRSRIHVHCEKQIWITQISRHRFDCKSLGKPALSRVRNLREDGCQVWPMAVEQSLFVETILESFDNGLHRHVCSFWMLADIVAYNGMNGLFIQSTVLMCHVNCEPSECEPDAILPCSTQPGRYGSLAQWFTRFLGSHGEIPPSRPGAHL